MVIGECGGVPEIFKGVWHELLLKRGQWLAKEERENGVLGLPRFSVC